MTKNIETSIEVDVPAQRAYNQWTQLEDFPRFMPDVEWIRQEDDRHVRWRFKAGGKDYEWDAEIVEQVPDQRIAWRSIEGPRHAGAVTFHRLSDARSKVMVQLEYDPEGFREKFGSALGIDEHFVRRSLKGFKEFLEERGTETGAWRGEIGAGGR